MASEKNIPLTSKFNVAVGDVALSLLAHGMYAQPFLHVSSCSVGSVICTVPDKRWNFPVLQTVVKICLLVPPALYFLLFPEVDVSPAKWARALWLLRDSNRFGDL